MVLPPRAPAVATAYWTSGAPTPWVRYADMTASRGRHPDEVADIVFAAVRVGQFWIPTSDGYDELINPRFEALLARELPPGAQFD